MTVDSFIYSRRLDVGGEIIGMSATLYVNPTEIFVAQISLSAVFASGVYAQITGITLQNGDFIDLFHSAPSVVEWAWTESVTFVLAQTNLEGYGGHAWATATATTYKA